MFTVLSMSNGRLDVVDEYDSLDEAILQTRSDWPEFPDSPLSTIVGPDGWAKAVLTRGEYPAICITTFDDDQPTERHRCRYLCDDHGDYIATQIDRIGEEPAQLRVEVDVPEGVSDEEALAVIERLSVEIDNLHRALGGHGLRVVKEDAR